MNKISNLTEAKIIEIERFRQKYPKIYDSISIYAEGIRPVFIEFKKFVCEKSDILGLDTCIATQCGLGKTLFYADIFQYLHDEKVKENAKEIIG
jgi:hypothetical protein